MNAATPVAVAAIAAIWLAGWPAARLLGLRGPLLIAVSWYCGGALLAALMVLCSAAGLPYSRPLLAACWCLAVGVVLVVSRAFDWPARKGRPAAAASFGLSASWGAAEAASVAVCAFQVLYSLVQAVRVPLGSFDAWSLWEYKGRRFWIDGGVTGGFLHDHAVIFAHPAYPPLLPLLMAWTYTWTGVADPALMKPLFPIFFGALLLAFCAALRTRMSLRWALPATAALALVPRVADYAGTGLADVPLAGSLIAAGALLATWRLERRTRSLVAAAVVVGVALLIKRDAAAFALAALAAVAVIGASWRPVLRFGAVTALLSAPWYAYVAVTGVPDRDFLPVTLHTLTSHAGRLGEIAGLFSLNLLAAGEWGLLWFLFVAVLVQRLLKGSVGAPLLLLGVVPPLVLYVISLSLSAWPDYMLHVRTSLDRLIMDTTPFALWCIVEQLRLAVGRPTSPQPAHDRAKTRVTESAR